MNDQVFFQTVVQRLAHLYHSIMESDHLVDAQIPIYKQNQIKPLYPQKQIQSESGETEYKKYSCGEICCRIEMGHFCCGGLNPGSAQLNKLGLGISLYFKFVVYMVCLFTIATLLVSANIFIYYQISNQNSALTPTLNSVLFSSTIGSLTSNLYQCTFAVNQQAVSLQVQCKVGTIVLYNPTYTNSSFPNVITCQEQISNSINNIGAIQNLNINKNCSNSLCYVEITNPSPDLSYSFVSLGYSCSNPEYSIAGYPITSKVVILLTVTADLVVVVLFVLWVYLQKVSEDKLIEHFKVKETSLQDFTIQVKNHKIPRNQLLPAVMSKFIFSFSQTVQAQTGRDLSISKFKVCDNIEKISDQYKKKELYEKLFQNKYQTLLAKGVDPFQMRYEQFCTHVNFGKFRKDIEKIFLQFKSYIYKASNNPYAVFITFDQPSMVEDVLTACKHSFITGGLQLKVDNKRYKVKRACRPDLIQWSNLNSHYVWRSIISWLVTLLILAISYVLIASAYIGQEKLLNVYDFKVNCDLLYNPDQLETWNSTLAGNNNWVNCYCSLHASNVLDRAECKSWLKNYSFYLFSPMSISLLIVLFNSVVAFIFRRLSKFQKHSNITSELYSYILKRTLLLIMNAGFIIVIVNQKLGVKADNPFVSFLFGGTFQNFDAGWYYNIGQVIIFTNLFNIILPMFQVVIQLAIKKLRKLFDTKCCTRVTSAVTKQEYFDIYSGIPFPIQERYAEIMSMVMLTFAYNAVIPILNLVAMLSLIFQLLSDKIMMFRVYRKPINYDHTLQRMVRNTILLCVLVHGLTSAFFIPQQGINIDSQVKVNINDFTKNQTLGYIISQGYVYPYLVLIALTIAWIVFGNALISLKSCLKARFQSSATREASYRVEQKSQLNVYELFSNHQIDQLLRVNKAELVKIQQDQKLFMFKKGLENSMVSLTMGAVVQYINNHGEIEVPQDWTGVDNYRKVLFDERGQLKSHQNQTVKVKLNGMPGYDPMFQKENKLTEVARMEDIVHEFYNHSQPTEMVSIDV